MAKGPSLSGCLSLQCIYLQLDSLLDSLSSSVILWRFHGNDIYSEAKEVKYAFRFL